MIVGDEVIKPGSDLVQEIIRVFKVRRLYDAAHPRRIEVEASAAGRIQAVLEAAGPIELAITEDTLSQDEEAVFRQAPGPESLAFLLFREGLRQITFYPGIDADEVTGFLDHVAATALTPGAESDLVARLWEENLVHIRYSFVEQLTDHEWIPSALEWNDSNERSPLLLVKEDLGTLDPPVLSEIDATLYFLDEAELAALHAELEGEKEKSLLTECLTCVRELLFDPVHEDPGPILSALGEIQASLLDQSSFEDVRSMHDLFEPYLQSEQAHGRAHQAFGEMRLEALDRKILARLTATPDDGGTRDAAAAAYLRVFGSGNLATLLAGAPDLKQLCQRAPFEEVFVGLAREDLGALRAALAAEEPNIVCGAAHLAGLIADSSLIEPLGAALVARDSRVRMEVLLALKHFDDARGADFIARMIDDTDPDIRLYALRNLIARRHAAALPQIAELLDRPARNGRSTRERRLVFEAYGALGGAGVVQNLAARLRRRGGLFRKPDPEETACVLVGLAATRSEASRRIVERATKSRDPLVRRVAGQVIAAWGERTGAGR